MMSDETLGGYLQRHGSPPAFLGSDGLSYSVEPLVDEDCHDDGQFRGAIMFIRWSDPDRRPDGHLETPYLTYGDTPRAAKEAVEQLRLQDLKDNLDRLIDQAEERPAW